MEKSAIWIIGQVVAIFIGVMIYSNYSLTEAFAVAYSLAVLVDIRENTQ